MKMLHVILFFFSYLVRTINLGSLVVIRGNSLPAGWPFDELLIEHRRYVSVNEHCLVLPVSLLNL